MSIGKKIFVGNLAQSLVFIAGVAILFFMWESRSNTQVAKIATIAKDVRQIVEMNARLTLLETRVKEITGDVRALREAAPK